MKRAITELTRYPDDRVFQVVAEGIACITENATSLDGSAARLHRAADFRASKILQGFAEEEAAKVLILIDFVRCPAVPERRAQTLKHFYGHVAKRIYALACTYPRIATFDELCNLVEEESRPVHLDGPNWVDWIVPNSISWERQQALYVDYVQGRHGRIGRVLVDDSPCARLRRTGVRDARLHQAELGPVQSRREFARWSCRDREDLERVRARAGG